LANPTTSSKTGTTKSPVAVTVEGYSKQGAKAYEDPQNWNSVYGNMTKLFVNTIEVPFGEGLVLDIGCGTGFAFDVLGDQIEAAGKTGIGIDPAVGMLEIAKEKNQDRSIFEFKEGSFDNIPLADNSVDQITSTLALHWVPSLVDAAAEMHRVLKVGGKLDILMVSKDDGANFKKSIVEAQKKHLTFKQIMSSAFLVQRVGVEKAKEAFAIFEDDFNLDIEMKDEIVYETFDEHMKWWKARSTQIIADVADVDKFMEDLRVELEQTQDQNGIPFDASFLWIRATQKGS